MKYIVTIYIVILTKILFSQNRVVWTSFDNLNDSLRFNKKDVIIKLEADWCGYCHLMDKKIFENKSLTNRIKKEYYILKLNIENKSNIIFRNNIYKPDNKQHELAKALVNDKHISLPCIVVFNDNLEIKNIIKGYLNKKNFTIKLLEN